MTQLARRRLAGLPAAVYEHPYDRNALASLRKMRGLDSLIRKFNEHGIERILRIEYTGSSLRINRDTFPEIFAIAEEACANLDIARIPELYVRHGSSINAATAGVDHPLIVLNSSCIDLLSADELLFVIGHELGHIKSQHLLYHQVGAAMHMAAGIVGSLTLGVSNLVYGALEAAFSSWMRMSELTADRAGLLACQDVNVANCTFAKMAGLPHMFYKRFNVDDLVAQAREFEALDINLLNRLAKTLTIKNESHPWTVMRAAALRQWESSNEFTRVLNGESPYCTGCGKFLAPDEAFCTRCGTRAAANLAAS
jgi:Zn-dependent protease with chaperone function